MEYGNKIAEIFERKMVRSEYLDMERKYLSLISFELIKMIINFKSNTSLTQYAKVLEENFKVEELNLYKKIIFNIEDRRENYVISKNTMIEILKKYGLNGIERRNLYKERVEELYELFLDMCNGDKEAYFKFNERYEEYVILPSDKNFTRLKKYIPFGIIVSLVNNLENPLNLDSYLIKDLKLLKTFRANQLIRNILPEIGRIMGIKRQKNSRDIINEVKNLVENEEFDTKEENEIEVETVDTLKLEIEQYKSSLSLIQNSLNELTQNIAEETEVTVNEKMKEFFVSLNSGKYGNILDKIPLTEELLKDIRKNNIEVPQEIKKVLLFVKSIIKFFRDIGITPIEDVNKIFIGTAEDIAEMDYIGSEFKEGEKKELKVIAPGYKYKDIVISIPKVEEVGK